MQIQTKIKVDKNVLKSAIRCNLDCSCTKDGWESCAKIDEAVCDMILHIDETDNENKMHSCKYHLPFGGEHYCICPARMYIYKNFGV